MTNISDIVNRGVHILLITINILEPKNIADKTEDWNGKIHSRISEALVKERPRHSSGRTKFSSQTTE